tara:strand:- start:46 stop:384 length:339 start_codon:yes stop_codon:yes gene_type:complete
MDKIDDLFDSEEVIGEYYTAIMSVLVALRAGYPYEEDEFINAPDGGYATLGCFFEEWGIEITGGSLNPIDLANEDEMEEETEDLVSELEFFNEIEAIDIMNADIGDLEGEEI